MSVVGSQMLPPFSLPPNGTLQTAKGPVYPSHVQKPPRPRKPSLRARTAALDREVSCDETMVHPHNGTLPNRFRFDYYKNLL